MQTKLNPYISFRDTARAAMAFYQAVFGGKLTMNTFKEFGLSDHPEEENLIMHAMLVTENGMTLMAADTPQGMEFKPGTNVSISLSGDNLAELSGYFEKLSAGGMVTVPLDASPWGDRFGMLTDQFGIGWMVNISK
jgi:PhnB protein